MINYTVLISIVMIAAGILAIIVLYSIIMFKGNRKEQELQLTTKNVLEQVKILYEQSEYPLVELLASKCLDRVPSHKEVRKYLAKAYYKDKKYNNSIKQCSLILRKNPNDIEIRQVLGDCYIAKGMYGKAVREYEIVFDKKSRDSEVLENLAMLYRLTEDTGAAISVYNILVTVAEGDDKKAEVYRILAELNEEIYDYSAAFDAYNNCLTIRPTDIDVNRSLTELYIKIGNNAKAIEALLFLTTIVSDSADIIWVYEKLIKLHALIPNYNKAIEYCEKLLELPGSDKTKVRNDIASFYVKMEHYDEGINILEELVLMSQNGYDVTVELADAYIKRKDYDKALNKYLELLDKATQKEAKKIRVLISDMYIKWAMDCAEKEDYISSYKYLELAEQYNTLNSEIYYFYAKNKVEQKMYSDAVELLIRAMEYDKTKDNHIRYLSLMADTQSNLNNFFEAKKALSDLLNIDENNEYGLLKVALLYIAQHDSKNAEEYLQKVLSVNPNSLDAKYNLALLYEINNKEKAKELLIEILDADPSYKNARTLFAELSSSEG